MIYGPVACIDNLSMIRIEIFLKIDEVLVLQWWPVFRHDLERRHVSLIK